MDKKLLQLRPVEMTRDIMLDLEQRGLILLLGPGKHEKSDMAPETGVDIKLYIADQSHGAHQLVAITKNQTKITGFGSHCANEEFLLIGDYDARPLYLLVALMKHDELDRKAAEKGLSAEDFVLLRCKFNDPECSFFTMLHDTPHCECAAPGDGRHPSFYVTEPSAMPSRDSELCGWYFEIITE